MKRDGDRHAETVLCLEYVRVGIAYRIGGSRRAVRSRSRGLPDERATQTGISRDQSKGPRASTRHERGILTETPAILAFVAQSFPAARLAPLDDRSSSRACRLSTAICVRPYTSRTRTGCAAIDGPTIRPRSPTMQRKVPTTVGDCFELIETTDAARSVGDGRALHACAIRICSRCRSGSTATAST